jgi:hypothetical protein
LLYYENINTEVFMKDEESKKFELNDDDLDAVAGGGIVEELRDMSIDYDYRCPCETCGTDSLWITTPTDVICMHCGNSRTRQWYDENKIRAK